MSPERRGSGQSDKGPRRRTVIQQPGTRLDVMLASQVESDAKTRKKLAALERAGDLLVQHAGELDFMRTGGVEAQDEFYLNAGGELRAVTVDLDLNGIDPTAILERFQRGLIAHGSSDVVRMTAVTRTYVGVLQKDKAAYLAEREAAKAAPGPQA